MVTERIVLSWRPKLVLGVDRDHVAANYVTGASTTRVGARKWTHKSCANERDVHKACLAGSVNHYLASPMTPSSSAAFQGNAREQEDRCVGPPIKCRDTPCMPHESGGADGVPAVKHSPTLNSRIAIRQSLSPGVNIVCPQELKKKQQTIKLRQLLFFCGQEPRVNIRAIPIIIVHPIHDRMLRLRSATYRPLQWPMAFSFRIPSGSS